MNDSVDLVVQWTQWTWQRERESPRNAIALLSESPGSATWYPEGSPHSGTGATIYVIQEMLHEHLLNKLTCWFVSPI